MDYYALVIILDRTELVDKVIASFKKLDIPGLTMFNSIGIGGHTLSESDIPLIAGLGHLFDDEKTTYNHTIISVMKGKELVNKAIAAAREAVGDFEKPDTGIMFSFKLDEVFGLMQDK